MLALQRTLTIDTLAGLIVSNRKAPLPDDLLKGALKPLEKIAKDAFNAGGKLGMKHVQEELK